MNCAHVHNRMQLYLDGRLDGQRLPEFARHLRQCEACRAELAMYQSIAEGAALVEPLWQPEALTRAIMLRIRQADAQAATAKGSRAFAPGWADAMLAAGMATLVTMLFLVFEPALRSAVSGAILGGVFSLMRNIMLATASWSPLVLWLVWIGLGVTITLWFAGREVRAGWRRNLTARLSR